MAYTNAEARGQLLDDLANGAGQIGAALAVLGEAYENLDDHSADRLEEELFRPAQAAYGRVKRTLSEFAARYEVPAPTVPEAVQGRPSAAKDSIAQAAEALRSADETISALQDSMLPVEVGDPELRAGLSQVRELISPLPGRAHEFLRTLGR
ncbi:MAG: hypothetical protein ACXVR1_07360 [Solirubrobacteraceae bacterium]